MRRWGCWERGAISRLPYRLSQLVVDGVELALPNPSWWSLYVARCARVPLSAERAACDLTSTGCFIVNREVGHTIREPNGTKHGG